MPTSVINTDDLREFKIELLEAITTLLEKQANTGLKKYLKSKEVMKFLHVSPTTLQTLRNNGTLPFIKIGGTIYYQVEDIQRVMSENRIQHNIGFGL